jgi:hypothetical protein
MSGDTIVGRYRFDNYDPYISYRYQEGNWDTLEYPGAATTEVYGIEGERIVGKYNDADGDDHGFVYDPTSNSPWTQVDYPGAIETAVTGVSGDHLTGYYIDASANTIFGFQYDTTDWNQLEFPGADATAAVAISGNTILGNYYYDADQSYPNIYSTGRGFMYDGTTWTSLVYPGFDNTQPLDMEGSYIVGTYKDDDGTHGFLYSSLSDPAWTTLDYPGAISTNIYGISGNSLADTFRDFDGSYHGFILNDPTLGGGIVPEPATLLLALVGLALLPRRRRR